MHDAVQPHESSTMGTSTKPTSSTGLRPLLAKYTMQHQFGRPLQFCLKQIFGALSLPESLQALVQQHMAEDCAIVYVNRGQSNIAALAAYWMYQQLQLPLPDYVGGAAYLWWQTPEHVWQVWQQRNIPLRGPWQKEPWRVRRGEGILIQHVLRQQPAYIALAAPGPERASTHDINDYLRALIIAQRCQIRPICIIPQLLIAREQSGAITHNLLDRLFGPKRRHHGLAEWSSLLMLRHRMWRIGEPIRLDHWLAENDPHAEADPITLGRALRALLQHRMDEEERIVAGPKLGHFTEMARRVLEDPVVRQAIATTSKQTQQTDPALEAKVTNDLRHIAARYNVRYIRIMNHVLRWLFHRIYDGIVVDEPGLQQALEAGRKGPLIYCPSHRSHIDYLVLSYVLWQQGVVPPHIAAGANLSFFPLGTLFRRCGAFFLRRSFRDDPLYAAVFGSYVRDLVNQGTSIEFFLEGTRSRTGKLLPPKYGLLRQLIVAWRQGHREDVQFVPISIDYEQIIEAQSYNKELQGAVKKTESLQGLLMTTHVLRSRYGRVQVQAGEPLSLRAIWQEAQEQLADGGKAPGILDDVEQQRLFVQRLAYRIMYRIAAICSATPTAVVATALLGHPKRAMAETLLIQRSDHIVQMLEQLGGRLSSVLKNPHTRHPALKQAVIRLAQQRHVVIEHVGTLDEEAIYRTPEEARIFLDYHKNGLMNLFAPSALVARALLAQPGEHALRTQAEQDTRFLSYLLKSEFIYEVGRSFSDVFTTTLQQLTDLQLIHIPDPHYLTIQDKDNLTHLAGLLDSFLAAYWICGQTLLALRHAPLWRRELTARAMSHARRAYLEGTIRCPEAANRTLIATALDWYHQTGWVQWHGQGQHHQPSPHALGTSKQDLQGLLEKLNRFL